MKRTTPFKELVEYIENEIFNFTIGFSSGYSGEITEFDLGYRAALTKVLTEAFNIYNRGRRNPGFYVESGKEETLARHLEEERERIKKG